MRSSAVTNQSESLVVFDNMTSHPGVFHYTGLSKVEVASYPWAQSHTMISSFRLHDTSLDMSPLAPCNII